MGTPILSFLKCGGIEKEKPESLLWVCVVCVYDVFVMVWACGNQKST